MAHGMMAGGQGPFNRHMVGGGQIRLPASQRPASVTATDVHQP
jgi:hypothetical protein